MFFRCTHNGACCEDPATQINITLGDIHRLTTYTKKSALQLYTEGVIGIWPFGDPARKDEFELDLGLFIPCRFRQRVDEDPVKKCIVYEARPLNCRLFPFWLIAELPMEQLKAFIKVHPCMANYAITADYAAEKEQCRKYTQAIAKILKEETKITEDFLQKHAAKKIIKTRMYSSKEEYRQILGELMKDLRAQDFSTLFGQIDQELPLHRWRAYAEIPELQEFADRSSS